LADSDVTIKKFVIIFCKNCRTKFEVSPPDDKHTFAAQSKTAFEIASQSANESSSKSSDRNIEDEVIDFSHECPKCKTMNKIYWGAPRDRFM
jgi:DNA-directed RNA polymerase subunit M/transcription elongation factor TFIIS